MDQRTASNTEIAEDEVEITRSAAAKLLGISDNTMKKLPINFRQYRPNGKALYRRRDVLAFKAKSTHTFD